MVSTKPCSTKEAGWGEVVDVLFPVETARTAVQSRVQSVEMIGSTNEQQTVVALKTIQLVEEERPVRVVDEGIQVFKD